MKLYLFLLLLPTLSFSQKTFALSLDPSFKVFVDSNVDQKVYLNVVETLTNSEYKYSFRKYEVESLEPVKNGIVYYIGANQYCFYNQLKGEGKVCEDLIKGYTCKEWKNENN